MMPAWWQDPNTRTRTLVTLAILAMLAWIVFSAGAALVPFLLGALAAYIMLPAVDFIDRHMPKFIRGRRFSRTLSILIVYILVLGLTTGGISYFVPLVTSQAATLTRRLPRLWRQIESLLAYDLDDLLAGISPQIQETIRTNVTQALNSLVDAAQKGVLATVSQLTATISFVIGMVIVPIWMFYVLHDNRRIERSFYEMIPASIRSDARAMVVIIDELLSAYLRGRLLVCLIVGVAATIVLLIFGIEMAVLLGTVAGVTEIIPIFGPYIGAVAPVLMALLDRPIKALWIALAFFAIQQLENMFLTPRISGDAVRFHPAMVMVIVVVGAELAGIWGLILGVPLAAIIRDVARYLYLRTSEQGVTPEMALDTLRASRH
ncbi:MAG: AI-2E family transporter [Anaerolineae bacterium]|jgi:predicted PurR-regulated permease PerM